MSDYMFMLENHLSSGQNRVVAEVQAAAAAADARVFLTGGAMRDMLGGFQILDLDFSVEGNALKMSKIVAEKTGARIVSLDENRRLADLAFPGGETAQIAMARVERYTKPAGKPHVRPATIQEDLRGRDLSINAIALSLNRASRGLLLDPANGLADLQQRELRTLTTYTFYDDPARLLRLIRFRVRLGFNIAERTSLQYANAREARLEEHIPPRARFEELKHIAEEHNPAEILRALEEERLLSIFSPALAGGKLNFASLGKLEKAVRLLPAEDGIRTGKMGPFFYALTEKLSPREKAELIKNIEMRKAEVEVWQKLEARAKKLEHALRSDRIKKPSQIYQIVSKAPRDEVVFLLYRSQYKPVQDRIRSYLQKYLPALQELPQAELSAVEAAPGTPKYEKAKEAVITRWLDRRPKKPPAPPETATWPPVRPQADMRSAPRGRGRY